MSTHTEWSNHLQIRGLRPWHKGWMDIPNEIVTFPLWDIVSHKLIGYQRYNWRETKIRDNGGKYFTWVSADYKDRAVYGLDNLFGHGPLFLTEGIWDSLRAGNCYIDCLALLTCSPSKNLKAHLRQLAGERPIIALCDNDENKAGDRLKAAADMSFYPPGRVKDVNELDHDTCFSWITEILKAVA